jgi:hypothetical protein
MAAKNVGKRLRRVGTEYGLPPLPPFEYQLFENPTAPPVARRLAYTIQEVFSLDEPEEEKVLVPQPS